MLYTTIPSDFIILKGSIGVVQLFGDDSEPGVFRRAAHGSHVILLYYIE